MSSCNETSSRFVSCKIMFLSFCNHVALQLFRQCCVLMATATPLSLNVQRKLPLLQEVAHGRLQLVHGDFLREDAVTLLQDMPAADDSITAVRAAPVPT